MQYVCEVQGAYKTVGVDDTKAGMDPLLPRTLVIAVPGPFGVLPLAGATPHVF